MKGVKITMVASIMLAMVFVGDAMAQCGGKQVYIELPTGWGANTYILWEAQFRPITGTKQGNWTIFTLPTNLSNDAANKQEIIFTDYGDYNLSSGINYITATAVGRSSQSPSTGKFTCSQFGTVTWIMEDPKNKGKVSISTQPPNAYNFYFLPPQDNKWTLGAPVLVWEEDGFLRKERLAIDPNHCGWYKKIWFNEPVPDGNAWVQLNGFKAGTLPDDQVGLRGLAEDPMDWKDGKPTPFNLTTQFGGGPGDLFFVPASGTGGWTKTDPGLNGICKYDFAAMIYYKGDVGNSFSMWSESQPGSEGICKGYVKETLDANGKMQWNGKPNCSTANGAAAAYWQNEMDFVNAFKKTTVPYTNYQFCYDMPFQRRPSGLWEFDASYLCPDGKSTDYSSTATTGCGGQGSIGGFYLDVRNYRDVNGAVIPRGATYTGNGFIRVKDSLAWCFDRGWYGTGMGDLNGKTTAAEIDAEMRRVCTRRFMTGELISYDNPPKIDINPTQSIANDVNGLFCFESMDAKFIYEPGQEFFIRGDDDIWIFINNQLVIDLGGNHMPAPGYVKLDTITKPAKLVEGQEYPIKIFFCDRRGPGSNMRIATNMYFSQKSGLQANDKGKIQGEGAQICMEGSGSNGFCGAVASYTGASETKCGAAMGNVLEYYLLNRTRDTLWLDPARNPGRCTLSNGTLTCYNGVILTNYPNVDRIQVKNPGGGLAGTYTVNARIKDPNSNVPPVEITQFFVGGSTLAVWGKIMEGKSGRLIRDLGNREKSTVSGRTVPIGFSVGAWRGDNPNSGIFDVAMETPDNGGAIGETVNITQLAEKLGVSNAGLKFYMDSLGTNEVQSTATFEIDNTGLLVLWVTGDYRAAEDMTYTVDIQGGRGGHKVNVYLPRIRFVDPTTLALVTDTIGSDPARGNRAVNRQVTLGTELKRSVAAYDISGNPNGAGVLCTTCNFPLSTEAWAKFGNANLNNQLGVNDDIMQFAGLKLDKGIANFSIVGVAPIMPDTFAYFKVGGPSRNLGTYAQWDSLLFKAHEFSYPVEAEIYDKNGDGFGDSLRITYNRKLHMDSLPNFIEVDWDPELPLGFGLGQKQGDVYTNGGFTSQQNYEYWTGNHQNYKLKIEGDNTIVIYGIDFSKNIKTSVGNGNIRVRSWETFNDQYAGGKLTHISASRSIRDKIPAIVVKATYTAGSGDCKATKTSPCRDKIDLVLSEPVKAADIVLSPNAAKTPFAYKMMARNRASGDPRDNYYAYTESNNLPIRAIWAASGTPDIITEKDSIIYFTYERYKDVSDSSDTPIAGDSVRFVWEYLGYYALTDLVGNKPNPNEKGRQIEIGVITSIFTSYSSLPPTPQIWQTASGMVNVDLGYMPAAPVALQIYDLRGKLVTTEQVNTRFANVKINVSSGVYLFRVGNNSIMKVLR
jgi:fibro-slime domain-containing protein